MRTPRQALRHIADRIKAGERFKAGMCKQETREAYLIPSDGSDDAAEAWSRTRYRFKGAWIPGAFMWWTGGTPDPDTGRRHGHVAVCGWRVGYIKTVDYPKSGRWNTTTVAQLERAWPRIDYAGTSLDIDGHMPRPFLPRIVRRWTHS